MTPQAGSDLSSDPPRQSVRLLFLPRLLRRSTALRIVSSSIAPSSRLTSRSGRGPHGLVHHPLNVLSTPYPQPRWAGCGLVGTTITVGPSASSALVNSCASFSQLST